MSTKYIQCSSIITKHREWDAVKSETIEEKEDNQTKQQGPPSMLIRRFCNHCHKQLIRHQVKDSFNNLNFMPANTFLPLDSSQHIKITNNKGKGLIASTYTTLSTHAFLDTSVNSSISYSALQ